MKKRLCLLFVLCLIIPNIVFAHEANTKVTVHVFVKEECDNTVLLRATLNELSIDPNLKDKFYFQFYYYKKTSDGSSLPEKAFRYFSSDNSEKYVYFVGSEFTLYFADKKYSSEETKTLSYSYITSRDNLIDQINYYYEREYDDLVEDIENGVYDDITYSNNDIVDNSTYSSDEDFQEFMNWLTNDFKNDKKHKIYLYSLIGVFTLICGLSILKKSIHKNR